MVASALIVSACASVAPVAPTDTPAVLPSEASAQPSVLSTSEPTVAAPSLEPALPTVEPTDPGVDTPTDPPTVTEPPVPTTPPAATPKPNLRVGKLEADQEPIAIDVEATFTADITNFADTASGPFMVQFVLQAAGQDDLVLDTLTVEKLAAGAATQVSTSNTWGVPGGFRLVARADAFDQINETDESDNERVLEFEVEENDVNLTLPADGLTIMSSGDAANPNFYLFTISMTNSGQSRVVGPMKVDYFGYSDAGAYVEWGTFDFDLDLDPGAAFNQLVGWTVEPGSYRAYALADSGENWDETDETDNEATVDFTAP